jgi:hypothetical protein
MYMTWYITIFWVQKKPHYEPLLHPSQDLIGDINIMYLCGNCPHQTKLVTTTHLLHNYLYKLFTAMQRLNNEGIHGTKSRKRSNRMVPPDVHCMVRAKLFKEGPYPENINPAWRRGRIPPP